MGNSSGGGAPGNMLSPSSFEYMLQAIPGCYLWIGAARAGENPGLLLPRYDFNDDVLSMGVQLWVSLIRKCLA